MKTKYFVSGLLVVMILAIAAIPAVSAYPSYGNDYSVCGVGCHFPAPVNHPPVANAGGPYSGTEDIAISFDGSGSSDTDGDALTYLWNFGDSSTGTGINPTHTYAAAGDYTVKLTVTDDNGASHTATTTAAIQQIVIPNQPPVAVQMVRTQAKSVMRFHLMALLQVMTAA